MSKIENLVDKYLDYLKLEKNYSEKTLETYSHHLNRFLDWMKVSSPEQISPTLIRAFRIKLYDYRDQKQKKLSPQTRNHHLIALRNFLRYLIRERGLEVMPPEKITLGRVGEREIRVLSAEQLRRLLDAPSRNSCVGKRDRAILELLFSTGLRVSELVSLNRDQINLKTQEFSVLGKGRKRRVVFISERAKNALKEYLATRKDDLKPLFIRYRGPKSREIPAAVRGEGRRLSIRSVERLVKKYVRRAGLSAEATPHTLRHSFATDLLRGGADIREVQEMLGHRSISTTQIYTHVTNRKLREVYRKAHSGNKRL